MDKLTIKDLTLEDAYRGYQEWGICCVLENGKIICEFECEDYCKN